MFELHQKRLIINGLEEQKAQMVAALWSNPNYDDTEKAKGHRQRAISSIQSDYEEAVDKIERALGNTPTPLQEEEKLMESNPFFQAAKRGLEGVDKKISDLKEQGKELRPSEDAPDYLKDTDQSV